MRPASLGTGEPQVETKKSPAGLWALILLGGTVVAAIGVGIAAQYLIGQTGSGCAGAFCVIFAGVLLILAVNKYLRSGGLGWAYLYLVLLIIPAGLFAFLVIRPALRMRGFTSKLPEYRATFDAAKGNVPAFTRGKLVVVDAQANAIDSDLMATLPSEMRADSSEEVEMILWEDCHEERIGTYGGRGGAANVWQCLVTLIDAKEKVVAGESKAFRGADPPTASQRGREQTGPRPKYEIIDYLKSLPRK